MLRLTLADNDIELYQNEPINLSYQFSDLQEINASRSSFSQTFRVPLTKKNQEYFGAVNEFGLITTWDPKTKIAAELSYNTIPLMRGFAQVKGIYIQKGRYADVELVVFGETANLSQDIGNGMLTDLDFSSFDHDLTATNLAASWAGTLSSGQIKYGIPDKGQNWTASNIWTLADPLETGDFTPYMRISSVLEKILTTAGYTYDSNFFSDDTDDMYLMLYNGSLMPIDNDVSGANLMLVGLNSDLTGLNSHPNFASITAWSEAGNFFDEGDNFTSGTTFTAPYRALYRFRINIYGRLDHATGDTISMRLSKNGSNMWTFIDDFSSEEFNNTTHAQLSPSFILNTGDTIELQYVLGSSGHTLALDGDGDVSNLSTWWQVPYISNVSSGGSVNVTANMPEIKQIDFISGIQKLFNLVFIPDRNNSKHLIIEPFNDYLASGSKKDWTNKVDLSKDIALTPTTDLQSRRYDWTHTNGKDIVNDLVFKSASRVYGRYRVEDPDNDFSSGTSVITSPFSPHIVSRIPGTGYEVHRMLVDTTQEQKSITKPLPRIAFWNGLEPGNLFYQNDDNTAVISAVTFPAFSQYSDLYATVTDDDLSFGAEPPFSLIEAFPLNTLYYKYWRPWANQLYSSDARKLTAYFRLTRSELATFEFSDKIFIKDTYWRILSIAYDATTEDLAKVEMLKVLGDIRDCTYIPNGINKANGRITFENAAGTTFEQVPRKCCERYGYRYDDSTAYCFQPFEQ
jgi:hypothetical protein